MSKIKIFDRLWDYTDWSIFFEPKKNIFILNESKKKLTYKNFKDITVKISGDGFLFDKKGHPIGGKISDIKVFYHKDLIIKITDIDQKLSKFYKAAFGKDADGKEALSLIFKGGSTFVGENGGDLIPAAIANGNDKVLAGRGDDWVSGDHGDDVLDGGEGYDVLTYQPVYKPKSAPAGAFAGIKLDVALATVIDPWGHHDKIANFEAYQGSYFADEMKGSAGAEEFTGGRGNDFIDGRGGVDILWYAAEAFYGGSWGIDANLATGRIKDSFGDIDTVVNVEVIAGTRRGDRFVGDAGDNIFEGLGSTENLDGSYQADWFDGGAGAHDKVSFINNVRFGAISGVIIHLELFEGDGGTISDGFSNGNYLAITRVEDIQGSTLGDQITGNPLNNRFWGEAGDDFLEGDAGDDFLDGGAGKDSLEGHFGHDKLTGGVGADTFFLLPLQQDSDEILDFSSAQGDKISVPFVNTGGLTPAEFFFAGPAATSANHRIIYDRPNGNLYYDEDGNGFHSQSLIAHFWGSPVISAKDLALLTYMPPLP